MITFRREINKMKRNKWARCTYSYNRTDELWTRLRGSMLFPICLSSRVYCTLQSGTMYEAITGLGWILLSSSNGAMYCTAQRFVCTHTACSRDRTYIHAHMFMCTHMHAMPFLTRQFIHNEDSARVCMYMPNCVSAFYVGTSFLRAINSMVVYTQNERFSEWFCCLWSHQFGVVMNTNTVICIGM